MGPYKLAAEIVLVGLLMAALYVLGWKAGRHGCEDDFTIYRQKQEIMQAQQQAAAKAQEAENEKRTYLVAQSYSDDLSRLNAALRRMREQASSASVSAAPISPQGAYAAASACEGTEFFSRALQAELMLEQWQKWAKVQGFPVR